MKSKHLKVMKELYNNFLDKTLLFEFYDDSKELNTIKELLRMGILNPKRYQIYDLKNSKPSFEEMMTELVEKQMFSENPELKSFLEREGYFNDEGKIIKHEYITTKRLNPVFTPEGEKYYFDHINKNWYKRIKDKWGVELLIDIFAIIGFLTGIILTLIQIFSDK